jgi:hypothetical protein
MPLIDLGVALVVVAVVAWIANGHAPISPYVRGLVNVVLGLIVIGMLLWLVNTYVPMAGSIRAILNIVVVVACCVWVLKAFGLWDRTVQIWHNLTSHRPPPEQPKTT